MVTIKAELHERSRAIFTSRGCSIVNNRVTEGGFTSLELLLAALGNASLNALAAHPLFRDEPLYEATVLVSAGQEAGPDRIEWIHWAIDLVVGDEAIVHYKDELESVALSPAICNLVNAARSVQVSIGTRKDMALRFLPPLASDLLRDRGG